MKHRAEMKSETQQSGAIHEDLERAKQIVESTDRAFGFVFAIVFTVLGGWLWFKGFDGWPFALAVAGAFLLAALVRSSVLAPLNRLWMRFGRLLHAIVSPVVLGLLFFAVMTPVGLMMRAFKKDPLRLALDDQVQSYWIVREPPGPDPQTMRNQF